MTERGKYSCGSDDITFCASPCDERKCFRHPSNMLHFEIPHSFAEFAGTKICPMKIPAPPEKRRNKAK